MTINRAANLMNYRTNSPPDKQKQVSKTVQNMKKKKKKKKVTVALSPAGSVVSIINKYINKF